MSNLRLIPLFVGILLRIFVVVSQNEPKRKCPSMCICDHVERFVMCADQQLNHFPYPLPLGTKLLGLSKNDFNKLTEDTFRGLVINDTLESLVMYNNKIETITPYSFQNLRKLKNLWIFGNRLTQVQANTFFGMENLYELDMSRNLLTKIENDAFYGLDNLKVLQLWGNNLTSLQPHSFSGLENLSNLTLGDNKFKEIPSASFADLKNLTSLEIINLPVERLPANAFATLNNLQRLHIGDWPLLTTINTKAFSGLSSLTYLSLYRCNLMSIPHQALSVLTSLESLLLSNNPGITSLSMNDFHHHENLRNLHLSNIGVNILHESPFERLTKLQTLDLSLNQIISLPSHIFFQLENLRSLNLSHNQLTVLSNSVFTTLTKLNTIDLSSNELVCDCDIRWLKTLQEFRIRQGFDLKGKCSDPIKYNGIDIVLLPPRKFICEAPKFTEKVITVTAKIGSNAILPCSPEHGVPTPSAHWTVPTTNELFDMHTIKMKNGSLLIKQVKQKYYGTYECLASNRFGEDSVTVIFEKTLHKEPPSSQNVGIITGILATTFIILTLGGVGYYVYRRKAYTRLGRGLYDAMTSNEETQRLPMKTGPKQS